MFRPSIKRVSMSESKLSSEDAREIISKILPDMSEKDEKKYG